MTVEGKVTEYTDVYVSVQRCQCELNKYFSTYSVMNQTACSVWGFAHELGAFHALSNPVFLGISLVRQTFLSAQGS